jgi:pyruvate dehydrogenase E2 component (dihydrolipoamide acetyltransferase)
MAVEFFIPKLGQTVEEVTLIDWLVEDKARVEQGQPILEVETDKAIFPVEANASGYLHRGPYKKGDVVPVVTTVALIGAAEDKFDVGSKVGVDAAPSSFQIQAQVPDVSSSDVTLKIDAHDRLRASPRARILAKKENVDLSRITPTGGAGLRVIERDVIIYLDRIPKVTPVAQRVAAVVGVDPERLAGTGPRGWVTKADVEGSLQNDQIAKPKATTTRISELQPAPGDMDVLESIPLKGTRGIIAERMSASVHTTARVTLVMEVDATEFVKMREHLKAKVSEQWGFAPGYNDLIAKITATALRKFPYMNARLTTDAIEVLKPINIGMAVDTERGLLVPVIREADKKSLRVFGNEFRQLVERSSNRKSMPDDLSGGTFTITNLGAYDVDAFTPVINLPQAAILGVGRIAPKAVAVNDVVVVRTMVTLSLVFDHRLVDGAPAARFLQYIKNLMEEPYLWISELQDA